MGLTPKPTGSRSLAGWNILDTLLQNEMKVTAKNQHPTLTVNSSEYEMSVDQIVSAGKEAGYHVETTEAFGSKYVIFS